MEEALDLSFDRLLMMMMIMIMMMIVLKGFIMSWSYEWEDNKGITN